MVDIHSHILPQMDDGANSEKVSVEILHSMYEQGVDIVVATPHFYPSDETVKSFIERRDNSYNTLLRFIKSNSITNIPYIKLGAEVHFSSEICKINDFASLSIESTDFILIELPFDYIGPWVNEMLFNIMGKHNLTPIIAHIERYIIKSGNRGIFDEIFDMNLPLQVNADSFLNLKYRKIINDLYKHKQISFFASDAHNTITRPVNIKRASEKIKKRFGEEFLRELISNSYNLINNEYERY